MRLKLAAERVAVAQSFVAAVTIAIWEFPKIRGT